VKAVRALLAMSFLCGSAVANPADLAEVVRTYCVPCHNARLAESKIVLDALDSGRPWAEPEVWERVLRQLRARTMPPMDNPRPDPMTYEALVAALGSSLDRGGQKAGAAPPRVTDVELATRLASFLWSSAPDAALIEAARKGRLHDPAVLDAQVRRMLADTKVAGLVRGFFDAWLGLNQVATMPADSAAFPELDSELRRALLRETELDLESQLREDRPAMELWTANYTYVNDRLARYYGIQNVFGPEFRRVPLPGSERDVRADASRGGGRAFHLPGDAREMDSDALPRRACAASDPGDTAASEGRSAECATPDAAGSFLHRVPFEFFPAGVCS
jgi:hypothetical protein